MKSHQTDKKRLLPVSAASTSVYGRIRAEMWKPDTERDGKYYKLFLISIQIHLFRSNADEMQILVSSWRIISAHCYAIFVLWEFDFSAIVKPDLQTLEISLEI